jgi:DNA-directed RNA polymerase subunit L
MKKFEGMIFDSDVKNDHIDFDAKIDIGIKHIREKTDTDNTFRVILKGMSVDNSVVNALRRTILMHVLVYGFERKNIFIENKKCIYMYNNDLIYNQIETLPIFDISNNFDLEDLEELKTNGSTNKKLVNVEIFLNVKNVSDIPRYVTTHDIVIKINDKVSKGYQNHAALSIIVLKPYEEIHLRAVANLNNSIIHAAYEATTFAYHDEISSMEYMLTYDTLGQLDKDVIFTKACSILIKKLDSLQKYVEELEKTDPPDVTSKIGEYELYGENDTLGNLLATILQKCEYTEIAGYVTPHLFMDHVVIKFRLSKKITFTPTQVFVAAILHAKKIFEHILSKMSKKS